MTIEKMTVMKPAFSDGPVLEPGPDDWLKREAFAKGVARLLSSAGKDRSVVFALYGRFGEGKTTVLNFVDHLLKKSRSDSNDSLSPVFIRFEPWIFSNSENLIRAFFSEVSSQLPGKFPDNQNKQAEEASKRLKKLGTTLEWAGKSFQAIEPLTMLLGVPGVARMLGKALKTGGEVSLAASDAQSPAETSSVTVEKEQFQNALAELNTPIVIVLDDFDRLTPDEVLLMMQLVKATTNFSGLHYLIVADRANIEKHLEKRALSSDYLDKIVQYDLTLPAVDSETFRLKLRESFQSILNDTKNSREEWLERWDLHYNAYGAVFFTTIRSVKRFMATFEFYEKTFREGGYTEVDLSDLWAVELLRVFVPECHRLLAESRKQIFKEDLLSYIYDEGKNTLEKRTEHIVSKAPEGFRDVVSSILTNLLGDSPGDFTSHYQDDFPGADELRLRSKLYFPAYFRLELSESIVRESEVWKWAQIAESESSDALQRLIQSDSRALSLSSIIRAVKIRWGSFTSKQKTRFAEALSAIEGSDMITAKASSNAVSLIWMLLEGLESSSERADQLASLAKCSARWPAILSFLKLDLRIAWQKESPLLANRQRHKLFKRLALAIQKLAGSGAELKLPSRIVIWIWFRHANPQALKRWILSQCAVKETAFNFLGEVGDTHGTSMTWNEKQRDLKLYVSSIMAAQFSVNLRTLRQHFHRHAQTTILPEERRMFEDAAWCMGSAYEDAACRKRIYKLAPQLEQHYVWIPEELNIIGVKAPLLVVPVDNPVEWTSKVDALAIPGAKARKCEVSASLLGKRSGALLIIVPTQYESDKGKTMLQQLGFKAAWLLRDDLLGVIEAKTGDFAWTGAASDRVFYAGPEKTRAVRSSD